jgi:hypothetical protein
MPIRFEAWQICDWVHPGSSCHGCQSVVEATMRSSTNVSLYRIAHCNLLRSELVCLIQTGPLSDHAIIQSAAVCTKSLARGPVRAIDPRTTLKNCSHCRINLRRFGAYPRTVPRLQFADLGPRERPLGLSLWMWDHLPRRVSFSPPTAFCTALELISFAFAFELAVGYLSDNFLVIVRGDVR